MKKIRDLIDQKEPETPYLAAQWAWNERYWSLISALKTWRAIGVGGVLASVILAGGIVAVSLQQKAIPFFVEFNEHSEAVRVTRADETLHPTTNQIRAALGSWAKGARSVYLDRRAQQDILAATYAMTDPDGQAYGVLHVFHTENNPYKLSQEHSTEVAVNSVMLLSGDTWRVEWIETKRDLSGREIDKGTWQATVSIKIIQPTTEAQILANPVGVSVNSFTWTRRI